MLTHIENVTTAINDLRQGKMVVLIDNPQRENEGDLIFPAEIIQQSVINFMLQHCSGIICLGLLPEQARRLGLDYMVAPYLNTSARSTPFTVSIDAACNITTGVSAHDRTHTILTAMRDNVTPDDLARPGHVFPLQAQSGGVLVRPGHTEGSIDLMRLAGYKPAAVLCEIMNPDGTMAKGQELIDFAQQHQLALLSIDDLIAYRRTKENLILEEASALLPIEQQQNFTFKVVKERYSEQEHIVLLNLSGALKPESCLVRIHSSCITGDVFGSLRCDCNQQLHYALQRIGSEGGMLIYLNQEGRGVGLLNKIKAYALQEQGLDTVDANQRLGLPIDAREYYIAANILRNHNINNVRLLTNNPNKAAGLNKYGIDHVTTVPMPVFCTQNNKNYLLAKKSKLNHDIEVKS